MGCFLRSLLAGKIAQKLRTLAVSAAPVGSLPTNCNSDSRGSDTPNMLVGPRHTGDMNTYRQTLIHINTTFFLKSLLLSYANGERSMALSVEQYFDQEAFALVINIVKFISRLALLKALLKSAFVCK